ncbi:MAG: AI-2E family transporter [Acetobacteraceae bacterium]|nr:AI-2E family transporter [Acetobacteraceae bacterium]MBV8590671.1 AI-2E family transporter [Acetobacteraceae bacterium]
MKLDLGQQPRAEKSRSPTQLQAPEELRELRLDTASVCLVLLVALASLYTCYLAAGIIVPLTVAAVLYLLLQPARRFLCERLHLPAALAAIVLIILVFALIGGIGFAIALPASGWIAKAPQGIHTLEQKLYFLREPIHYMRRGLEQFESAVSGPPGQRPIAVQQTTALDGVGLGILQGTRLAMSQLLVIVVVLFFLLAAGDAVLRSIVEILPRFGAKKRLVEIVLDTERNISAYLATITMMNAVVGVANGIQTWLCGLHDPLLWGTLAFLLNYIPILGPLTGIMAFFLVGLFTYDVIWWAFLPAGIYLAIHVAEGEAITPMLVAYRFTLNPVLVIMSLFFWHWMWGVIGALLAVPLLAITKIFCDRIEPLAPIGHLLGGSRKRYTAAT